MICAANGLPCFKDLIAVLFECFSIISLGYLSCRFKLVSSQAKDLNSYLTNLALPMIIFLNIAQMEFRTINLSFLLCVLAAKLLVFLTVTLLTLTISYPTNFGYAGSLAILATQSNDFALGYPLIKLLYGESRPEMLNYLSLMAPIQLLILNPLGIAMLEFQKSKNHRKKAHLKDRSQDQNNNINETDNNNNYNERKSPEESTGRSCCRPCEQSRLVANNRQLAGSVSSASPMADALANTYPNESKISSPPARLFQAAYLLQTSHETHQPKSSSNSQPPRLIDSSMTIPKTDMLLPRLRVASNDDERRRLKFRQKNVRSLVLALPAQELLSRQQHSSGSERELRRASSAEQSLNASTASHLTTPTQASLRRSSNLEVDGFNDATDSSGPVIAVKRSQSCHSTTHSIAATETKHKSQLDLSFFKALATNPLILASIIALLVNLIHGPELPKYITRVSNTIAASFAAPALFVVGLSMYGKFELLLRNPRDLLLSSVMVLSKGLLLPSLVRTIALLVVPSFTPPDDVPHLVDFAFLYGLLPTAPTACIIAKQYGVLQNVVSISMLLSTIMAGPLTLASSVIISPTSVISVSDIENVITRTMEISAVLTLFLAPFTLYTFLKPKNSGLSCRSLLRASRTAASAGMKKLLRANPIRVFVLLLALSQIMIGIGGFLWFFIDTTELNDNSRSHPAPQVGLRMEVGVTHNVVDLLDEPLNESRSRTTPVPLVLRQLYTGQMLSPRRTWLADHHRELCYNTLSSLRYVLSASGLMMAQFCTLSLVLVIAATKLRDRATGRRVSELLLKVCFSVLVCLVVWLVYDSEQLVHLPVESSLPSSAQSLSVRLVYNVAILAICLPIYAIVIRVDNRMREAGKNQATAPDNDFETRASSESEVNTFVKRRFVTSSASLSSDASSAATSNTNLDSTLSSGPCVAISVGSPANQAQVMTDSLSIILDTKVQDSPQSPDNSPAESLVIDPEAHIFGPTYVSSLASSPDSNICYRQQQHTGNPTTLATNSSSINSNNDTKDLEKSCDSKNYHSTELGVNEFNEYSTLIVFMLINSTLNLFSVAQKLLHEEPVGTFRQIEVVGVAFEFGQGLLTFLIYGTKGLFDRLFCKNRINCGRNS